MYCINAHKADVCVHHFNLHCFAFSVGDLYVHYVGRSIIVSWLTVITGTYIFHSSHENDLAMPNIGSLMQAAPLIDVHVNWCRVVQSPASFLPLSSQPEMYNHRCSISFKFRSTLV
jgi:hypothetical protein